MRGTASASLCKHSLPPSKQCKHMEAHRDAGKVSKKKLQNLSFTQKYRDEHLPTTSVLQVICCFYKFCPHTVTWKHVDTCKDLLRSKCEKQGKTMHFGIPRNLNGKSRIWGKKPEFGKNKNGFYRAIVNM